jgi:hypothetical protein
MRTRTLFVAVAALLTLSGCGGGSDSDDPLGAADVAVTTTIAPEEAVALAQSAVVTAADVDPSWVLVPRSPGAVLHDFQGGECAAMDAVVTAPGAASDFQIGDAAFLTHEVKVVGETEAVRAVETFRAPGAIDCLTAAHARSIANVVEPGSEVSVNVLPESLGASGLSVSHLVSVKVLTPSGIEFSITAREDLVAAGPGYLIVSSSEVSQQAHDMLLQKAMEKLAAISAVS